MVLLNFHKYFKVTNKFTITYNFFCDSNQQTCRIRPWNMRTCKTKILFRLTLKEIKTKLVCAINYARLKTKEIHHHWVWEVDLELSVFHIDYKRRSIKSRRKLTVLPAHQHPNLLGSLIDFWKCWKYLHA